MRTITCELGSPIKYAMGNGNEVEGSFIEISEPTGKIAHLVALLKTEIGSATKQSLVGIDLASLGANSQGNADEEESDPMSAGESTFSMLTMGGANMQTVMITFKEILRATAQIGGEKDFTSPMFDRMSYNDVEGCLKLYLGNFLQA